MPLTKSKGNMYPWVTHTHSHLAGRCSHGCRYCYVQAMERRYMSGRYAGPVRLVEKELDVKYGEGKTIFVEHMNDLLAQDVTDAMVGRIITHCAEWPDNTFVFQSKNPGRFFEFDWPVGAMFGTTIETNRDIAGVAEKAPRPANRAAAMAMMGSALRKFVTIEPVLDFDVEELAEWIRAIGPEFVNIGADSKGSALPEPSLEKILELVEQLTADGNEIREKHNLERLRLAAPQGLRSAGEEQHGQRG